MNNETFMDFCFIRNAAGNFSKEISAMLERLFKGQRLYWYLDEKTQMGLEIVVAEIKGMSTWKNEEEVCRFLEKEAGEPFWSLLQGFIVSIYPAMRGCTKCGDR